MESIEINKFKNLPSGENINQGGYVSEINNGIEYQILSDNTIEYIDFLNATKVLEIMAEFFDVNCIALAKENKLSAVALGSSLDNAFDKIMENDPISLIDSTLGFTKEINLDLAKKITSVKIRNLVGTKFDKEALTYLEEKTNINIIKICSPLQELLDSGIMDIKPTPFGYLIQEQNISKLTKSSFKVAGKTKPTQQLAEDAIFAWKIAKYANSRCAVVAKDLSTKAIVQSNINIADATELAIDLACENSKDSVLAVDGVIEQIEVINAAIQGRVGLIIESGDIDISNKIVNIADKYNIPIIHTGIRNYKY